MNSNRVMICCFHYEKNSLKLKKNTHTQIDSYATYNFNNASIRWLAGVASYWHSKDMPYKWVSYFKTKNSLN